jgi:hypothetical protein
MSPETYTNISGQVVTKKPVRRTQQPTSSEVTK